MLSSTCNCVKRVNNMYTKQHVHCCPLQAHDAGSSSRPKRIVNQADVLMAPFVKDPHIHSKQLSFILHIPEIYSIMIDMLHFHKLAYNFTVVRKRKQSPHSISQYSLCVSQDVDNRYSPNRGEKPAIGQFFRGRLP